MATRTNTWVGKAHQWWSRSCEHLWGLVYPAQCVGCGVELDVVTAADLLCGHCREMFHAGYAACGRCAMPLGEFSGQPLACNQCRQFEHRFAAALALGTYDGLLRSLVVKAKNDPHESAALALGKELAQRVAENADFSQCDGVVAVPSPGGRRIWRTGHLADFLAEIVAARLNVPLLTGVLRFRRGVKTQHNLPPAQRRRNLRHALVATATYDIKETRLLVIDDVLTTGATADETSRALLEAGARVIVVAVAARGVGLD